MRWLLVLILTLVPLAGLRAAAAQDAATLVADRVFINGNDTLTAEGGVEVLFRGQRLRAARITYDRGADRLTIEGPITVTDGAGTTITAEMATLSRDLSEGVLTSARMVLQDQLQLAAASLRRVGGRYTTLDRVVASSCQVCPSNPVPLWEIRARAVSHDQQSRQLTFDDAQFRVAGIPILWLPRLRMPDPTVERATGLLQPKIRTTSALGFGLKLPYFITLGPSRDLTVTPYLSASKTRTLELRYRQAFATGRMHWSGAVTRDTLRSGTTRGYLFGTGEFALPDAYLLSFGVEATSDPAYLLDYGISDKDRLASGIDLTRVVRDRYVNARLYHYRSIRSGENNATLPALIGDATLLRRFAPPLIGGEAALRFALHDQRRSSRSTLDLDGDGVADGRDVARATAALDWRRQMVAPNGIIAAVMAGATLDFYAVAQDTAFPGTITRFTPHAGVELRWPFLRTTARASETIEPIVQLIWTPDSLTPVPNEDSRLVEFDEGNLFALNRFPGADGHERGLRMNAGLSYTRVTPRGWTLGIVAGRVIRAGDLGQFTAGSGLSGQKSDWLLTTQIQRAGLNLTNRAVFDDAFSFTRDEMRLGLVRDRYTLTTSYIWQIADLSENRPTNTSEFAFDAGVRITRNLNGALSGRYDLAAARATKAALGLIYRTDCAAFDLSLSRRFTSSTSVRPVTDFGVSVSLAGFGTGSDGKSYRRACGR